MHAERQFGGGVQRIVPGAGRDLHDAGPQRLAQQRAGEAAAALVVELHDVAVLDVARRGVLRMQAHRLATIDLRGEAGGAEIQLAVQPGRRLVGDQLQWEAGGGRRSSAFGRRQPGRVSRTIVVAEFGNRCGADLDRFEGRAEEWT